MKTLSYVVDLSVFFALLYVFEINWFIAFIISEIVGFAIRAAFLPNPDAVAAESE